MEKYATSDLIEPCKKECSFCFLNYTDDLSRNNLFRSIPAQEIGVIIRKIHHQVREYGKGDVIAHSGDPYNRLLIVMKGSVVGEIIDFEGRTMRIEELKAPDTIASAFLFGEDNRLPVSVTATEETRLLVIDRTELMKLFKLNDQILINYLNSMANRTQHLSKKIKMLGFQTIRSKIANYLLEMVKKSGSDILLLQHTQHELAALFGVTRPAFSRTLREMHHAGYIKAEGKRITIVNKLVLSELLN
jgi:CRP/FNR family transcriptional regulator, dissimilatory nitrate respiration regulator